MPNQNAESTHATSCSTLWPVTVQKAYMHILVQSTGNQNRCASKSEHRVSKNNRKPRKIQQKTEHVETSYHTGNKNTYSSLTQQ